MSKNYKYMFTTRFDEHETEYKWNIAYLVLVNDWNYKIRRLPPNYLNNIIYLLNTQLILIKIYLITSYVSSRRIIILIIFETVKFVSRNLNTCNKGLWSQFNKSKSCWSRSRKTPMAPNQRINKGTHVYVRTCERENNFWGSSSSVRIAEDRRQKDEVRTQEIDGYIFFQRRFFYRCLRNTDNLIKNFFSTSIRQLVGFFEN